MEEIFDNHGDDVEWLKKQTSAFQAFAGSSRFLELEVRFWRAPPAVYKGIPCNWDFASHAQHFNWEVPDESTCTLYEGPVALICRRFHKPASLLFPQVYGEVDRHRFLWVIDHWLRDCSLTPPCLTFLPNGTLGKRDGFHRLAAAAMIHADPMPFWGIGHCTIPEISPFIF